MSADRGHILVLTKSDDWDEEHPYFNHQIECLNVEKCGGWAECMKPHEVDGKSANDGPWDADDDDPWIDEEEFTFHGVEHTWHYGYGWTTPFKGCVVAENDAACDYAHDIGVEHGPGRYVVDDEWDDTDCTLMYVGPAG